MTQEIVFLSIEQVTAIHKDQIDRYGGSHGIRDSGLIRSAVAQPLAMFGGQFLHPTIYLMAAAYLLSLSRNHGFLDGNKRTAAVTARVFLQLNDIILNADEEEFFDYILQAAQGKVSKEELASFFEHNSESVHGSAK